MTMVIMALAIGFSPLILFIPAHAKRLELEKTFPIGSTVNLHDGMGAGTLIRYDGLHGVFTLDDHTTTRVDLRTLQVPSKTTTTVEKPHGQVGVDASPTKPKEYP